MGNNLTVGLVKTFTHFSGEFIELCRLGVQNLFDELSNRFEEDKTEAEAGETDDEKDGQRDDDEQKSGRVQYTNKANSRHCVTS